MHAKRISPTILLVALAVSCHCTKAENVQYIRNSVDLDELRTGERGLDHDTIVVEYTAHSNPLMLPKYFWSYPYNTMNFTDIFTNRIMIKPKEQKAFATFISGRGLSAGLPLVFKEYYIDFGGQSEAHHSLDVHAILQWNLAQHLVINDENDLVSVLADRVNDMKGMHMLKSIVLNVNRKTYTRLQVRPFLEELPTLESATFVTKRPNGLNETELTEFLLHQTIPDEWTQTMNDVGVVYSLKQRKGWSTSIFDFVERLF